MATKAQKEEHRMWKNLNEFRKQFYMLTLPKNVNELLFTNIPDWADEPPIWDSDEEKEQARIKRRYMIKNWWLIEE